MTIVDACSYVSIVPIDCLYICDSRVCVGICMYIFITIAMY